MIATKKHEIVYKYIVAYKCHYDGNSPSIREIGVACEISSTSMVWYYLQKLVVEGLIEMSENTARPRILVKGGVWRLYGENISV
jgi:SOS-response transcriptional repressor LexA